MLTRVVMTVANFVCGTPIWFLVGGLALALVIDAARSGADTEAGADDRPLEAEPAVSSAIVFRADGALGVLSFAVDPARRRYSDRALASRPALARSATPRSVTVWRARAIGKVREGVSLADTLRSNGFVAEDLMLDMVQVGETTGALDQMLSDVSDFLDEEVETRMQRVLGLIEPAMLVIMALLVALLLVAVYLPMYSLLGKIAV